MVLVASLPGAVVLIVAWLHRDTRGSLPADPRSRQPATARPDGVARG
jgi:hypothetical protein